MKVEVREDYHETFHIDRIRDDLAAFILKKERCGEIVFVFVYVFVTLCVCMGRL